MKSDCRWCKGKVEFCMFCGTASTYKLEPFDITIPAQRGGDERQKPKPVKTVGYGSCHGCMAPRIGLVRQGNHLVWKVHNVMMMGRGRPVCHDSGQYLCTTGEGTSPLNPESFAATCGGLHRKEIDNHV